MSLRNSVFIIEGTIETIQFSTEEFSMSKFYIKRVSVEKRKEPLEAIKVNFQSEVPNTVTVHWNGKLLPALDMRKFKEERIPMVIMVTTYRSAQIGQLYRK